jgi:hypothetical protein
MSKRSELQKILQEYYIKNDSITFDMYLGDIYKGSDWRLRLEDRFIKELSYYELSDENIRKAARNALKYISKKLKEAIDSANEKAMKEGKEPTYRRMASNNEIVAKQLSETVEQRLEILSLDLVKEIAKQLAVTISQKTKQDICSDISNKLTKPVKVTKQLHRGKWSIDSTESDNYKHLLKHYYSKDARKFASSEYTILKICGNIEDTLYTDLDEETIFTMSRALNVKDYENRSLQDLCQSITRKLTS